MNFPYREILLGREGFYIAYRQNNAFLLVSIFFIVINVIPSCKNKMRNMPHFTSSQIEQLKWIGLCSMVLDHIAVIYALPDLQWLRIIGRSAFLIFGFIVAVHLARGDGHIKKYAIRMLSWALLSQLPYQWGFNDDMKLNILFQFFAVIIYIAGWRLLSRKQVQEQFSGVGMIILAVMIAMFSDYHLYGFVYCLFCYLYVAYRPNALLGQVICGFGLFVCALALNAAIVVSYLQSDLFPLVIIAIGLPLLMLAFPMSWRTIEEGKQIIFQARHTYFFYVFYPLHILLLYAGKMFLKHIDFII